MYKIQSKQRDTKSLSTKGILDANEDGDYQHIKKDL